MEENTGLNVEGIDTPKSDVGFPEVTHTKKRNFGVLILVVLALIIAGFFVYSLVLGGESKDKLMKDVSPTPFTESTNNEPTETPVEKELEKKDLKVSILNGSGTPGLASILEKKIVALGFSDIETGNADSYDYKITEVSFSSSVSDEIRDEVTKELKKIYNTIDLTTKSPAEFDIQIIIGGSDSKTSLTPSLTPTKSSVTPTKAPTQTLTPTNNPTVSPSI